MSVARTLPIVAIALLVAIALASDSPDTEAGATIPGDADCSGAVQSVDALHVLQVIAGIAPAGECTVPGGDVDCSGDVESVDALQILRFLAAIIPDLPGCGGSGDGFSYEIDTGASPGEEFLPGIADGPPRKVAAVVGPEGDHEEFVEDEVILHPSSNDQLNDFLERYGGTIVRDGMPRSEDPEAPPPGPDEKSGWYQIRIDTATSALDDFVENMEAAGLEGHVAVSSEGGARLLSLAARETDLEVSPNFLAQLDVCSICEHPDGMGGYVDAATWWEMSEDSDPNTPGEQGASIGVVHAWEYMKYHGYPAEGVPYFPVKVAVIDAGFDLNETTGYPNGGNDDYFGRPPQLDEVGWDHTAGGPSVGFANCKKCWHGQMTYGICCALARNQFGSAGTSGGWEIRNLIIKVTADIGTISQGVYDAIYNNADVINMSISFDCTWTCRNFDGGNELAAYVVSARNVGSVVVASAGNGGDDISGANIYPCKLAGVICVGAIGSDLKNGEDYGTGVDIWAPHGIYTTVTPDSAATDADDVGIDELHFVSGSSMSSPFVAGVVAMMKMLDGSLRAGHVASILTSTANSSPDPKVSGYVDAFRAVAAAKTNQPPTVLITDPSSAMSPYGQVLLRAEVLDPENPGIAWGVADFTTVVEFLSSIDGPLCSDSGDATGGGTAMSCTVPQLSLGTHTITAKATDPFGAVGTAATSVTVMNTPPVAQITYPPEGSNYYASQMINLRGFGFDPDEVLTDSALVWGTESDASIGTGPDIWVQLPVGTQVVALTVTDSFGAVAVDTVTIHVQAGGGYPTVQITSPPNNTVVGLNTQLTFTGTANDPEDGALSGASLKWTSNIDGVLGSGTSIQVVLSGSACNSTVHTITLEATDSDGHKATHSINVSVVQIC